MITLIGYVIFHTAFVALSSLATRLSDHYLACETYLTVGLRSRYFFAPSAFPDLRFHKASLRHLNFLIASISDKSACHYHIFPSRYDTLSSYTERNIPRHSVSAHLLAALNMGSNALAFKEWAVNENIVNVTPIENFKGARIGIDAENYLHSLLSLGNREPLLPAHAGLPFTLKKRVDEDIQSFQDAGIEPFFLFNGLDLACKDRASILSESRKASAILHEAWLVYDQGQGEDAVQKFGKACKYIVLTDLFILSSS